MVTINLKTTFPQVIASLNKLAGDELGSKALISAMNKTLAQGRTAMNRAITAEFAIKASDVRDQIYIDKARFTRAGLKLVATLEAFGRRRGHRSRNVMLFGARQVFGKQTKRVRVNTPKGWRTFTVPIGGGVSVKIKRAGGRKLIKGAFIANKGRTVFMRIPGQGRKIRAVETVDVPQMFNTRRINKRVIEVIEQRFPRIFESEARFFLNRFSGGNK